MRIISITLLASLIPVFSLLAQNPAAEEAFKTLYGDKVAKVARTPTRDDDVALAAELVEVAAQTKDQKSLLSVFCDNAYTLGSKTPKGYPHAISAMQLLLDHVPARKAEALANMIRLLEKQYVSARSADEKQSGGQAYMLALMLGAETAMEAEDVSAAVVYYGKARSVATRIRSDQLDPIKQKQAEAIALRATHQKLERLQAALKANPKDAASAKQLVEIYLAELDRPDQARKYSFLIADPILKARVSMTGRPIETLAEVEALDMAKWYHGHANRAKQPHAKVSLLERTRAYYGRYLALHVSKDLERKTAELIVGRIDQDLEKLAPKDAPAVAKTPKVPDDPVAGKWVDLGDKIAGLIEKKAYENKGAEVTYKNGVLRMKGEGKGEAYVSLDLGLENVIVSMRVRKGKGFVALVGARASKKGHYHVAMSIAEFVTMSRLILPLQIHELGRQRIPALFAEDGAELQFAVIKNRMLLFVDGKLVLQGTDDGVAGKGALLLGVNQADATFAKIRYQIPSEALIKKLTGESKEKTD